nr:MAG TPA: hypothetical protein [Caudoviricetes sp.]
MNERRGERWQYARSPHGSPSTASRNTKSSSRRSTASWATSARK